MVTGTPLGQPQYDPRCRYQAIYRQVAALLNEPVAATVPVNQAPWWQNWLDSVERFAAELNWTCSPPPTVWVMGAEANWTVPAPVPEQGAVLILRDEQTGSAQQLILPGKALPAIPHPSPGIGI